jgi:methionyl-tRNA formyltransferase
MLLKATTPISLLENALDLAKTLSEQAADLLVETLIGLEQGRLQPIPQDDAQATYAPLIQKEDYALDWSRPAIELHNQVRGFYPNCFTTFRDTPLKITATLPLDVPGLALPEDCLPQLQAWETAKELVSNESAPSLEHSLPGTIVALLKNNGAVVQTGAGVLLLKELQLAGKRSQSGWDFVNGMRLEVGERLGNSELEAGSESKEL